MGFWKAAGKLAAEVAKDALSNAREVKATHEHLEDKSSTELRKITTDDGFFSSTTSTEKRLARNIMRNRGDRS
ncbi:transposase [Klebsiella michiganensis]